MTAAQLARLSFMIVGVALIATVLPSLLEVLILVVPEQLRHDDSFTVLEAFFVVSPQFCALVLGILVMLNCGSLSRWMFKDEEQIVLLVATSDLLKAALLVMGLAMVVTGLGGLLDPEILRSVATTPESGWPFLVPIAWLLIGGTLVLNPRPIVKYWRWRSLRDRKQSNPAAEAR